MIPGFHFSLFDVQVNVEINKCNHPEHHHCNYHGHHPAQQYPEDSDMKTQRGWTRSHFRPQPNGMPLNPDIDNTGGDIRIRPTYEFGAPVPIGLPINFLSDRNRTSLAAQPSMETVMLTPAPTYSGLGAHDHEDIVSILEGYTLEKASTSSKGPFSRSSSPARTTSQLMTPASDSTFATISNEDFNLPGLPSYTCGYSNQWSTTPTKHILAAPSTQSNHNNNRHSRSNRGIFSRIMTFPQTAGSRTGSSGGLQSSESTSATATGSRGRLRKSSGNGRLIIHADLTIRVGKYEFHPGRGSSGRSSSK